MNKRALIITVAIMAGIVLVSLGAFQTLFATATLDLRVAPTDAKVVVDGQSSKAGPIKLTPGKHSITVSRDGFTPQTVTVQLKSSTSQTQNVALAGTSSQAFADWEKQHPDQTAEAEGVAGATLNAQGDIITQNNPIIQHLPYTGFSFAIAAGPSKAHPDNRMAIALYVASRNNADAATAKTQAQNWIRAQGYDPSKYEIIYQ